MVRALLLSLALFSHLALAVGSTSVVRKALPNGELVVVSFVGDASGGTVPDRSLGLYGYVEKVVTNPGSTGPSANYDITLGDPSDSALDALASALLNRHTSTTEQVYPRIAGTIGTVSSFKPFLSGQYTLAIANTSVNSATGTIEIYLSKP
jgi:hypothetical protein